MAAEFFRQVSSEGSAFASIGHLIKLYEDGLASQSALLASYYDLVAAGAFTAFLQAVLKKILDDPAFAPNWTSDNECAIIGDRRCTLSIRQVAANQDRKLIYAASGLIILTLMSSDSIDIDIYQADGPTKPLTWLRKTSLNPGESIEIAPTFAFRYSLGAKPALFSRMLVDSADYTAVYDAESLDFISMLSLDQNNTRWYFMAKLASQLASPQAAPLLEELTRHHDYNVRWTALQELFNHDTDQALAILNRFKTDPNEFIQEQARMESARIDILLAEED